MHPRPPAHARPALLAICVLGAGLATGCSLWRSPRTVRVDYFPQPAASTNSTRFFVATGGRSVPIVTLGRNSGFPPITELTAKPARFHGIEGIGVEVKFDGPAMGKSIGINLFQPGARGDFKVYAQEAGAGNSRTSGHVWFSVSATRSWQATGVRVGDQSGTTVHYKGGRWTSNPTFGHPLHDAAGYEQAIAGPGYPVPRVPEGSLVGRVGRHVFPFGCDGRVPTGLKGELQLTINDDLDGRVGDGLRDNLGAITVEIIQSHSHGKISR